MHFIIIPFCFADAVTSNSWLAELCITCIPHFINMSDSLGPKLRAHALMDYFWGPECEQTWRKVKECFGKCFLIPSPSPLRSCTCLAGYLQDGPRVCTNLVPRVLSSSMGRVGENPGNEVGSVRGEEFFKATYSGIPKAEEQVIHLKRNLPFKGLFTFFFA